MKLVLLRPPVVHLSADIYGSIPGIPSGIAYLAAAVRSRGHDVKIIDAYGERPHRFYSFRDRYVARGLNPAEAASRIPADCGVAGVSVHCCGEHSMALEIVAEIRALRPAVKIVVGGYHATFLPEKFLDGGADFVVMGEGEERLPRLLESLDAGEDPEGQEGLATKRAVIPRTEGPVDLEAAPFAAVDLLPLESYWKLKYGHGPFAGRYMNMMTSRGCPYRCSFCQAPLMSGGRWTAKSPSRVLEEIEFYRSTLGVSDFHIQDENFATDRARAASICRALAELPRRVTFCFPSGVKMETLDEEMIRLLASAGCRYISLSPESGSSRVLSLMNKVADIERVPSLLEAASSAGIRTCAFMATGYPGETKEDRRLTAAYVRRLARAGADEVIMPIVTPFPATPAMSEPALQGFREYDELCFSPVWRPDYGSLNRYRNRVYLSFLIARILFRPLAVLRQMLRLVTGRFGTKTEMTVYRKLRDLPDLAAALVRSEYGFLRPGRNRRPVACFHPFEKNDGEPPRKAV